jgi:hypothetical protein
VREARKLQLQQSERERTLLSFLFRLFRVRAQKFPLRVLTGFVRFLFFSPGEEAITANFRLRLQCCHWFVCVTLCFFVSNFCSTSLNLGLERKRDDDSSRGASPLLENAGVLRFGKEVRLGAIITQSEIPRRKYEL